MERQSARGEGSSAISGVTGREGDAGRHTAAFETLYERHVDGIYRYCRLRLPSDADAEDATAVTFERAFAAYPPKSTEALRAWLFTIAHNVIASIWRSRARSKHERTIDDDLQLIDPGISPDEALLVAEERRELIEALAEIPPDQRTVIELRLAGLTGAEICAVLDRSPAAMRQLQYRAVQNLKRRLTQEDDHAVR